MTVNYLCRHWGVALVLIGMMVVSANSQNDNASNYELEKLFLQQGDVLAVAFTETRFDDARQIADQIFSKLEDVRGVWLYGNFVHDVNVILGLIALAEDNETEAGKYLIKAGASPGSPQLDSFGPNVTLAQELLKRGHSVVVLAYFDLVGKFWKSGEKKLAAWRSDIDQSRMPDFGANLRYGLVGARSSQ